MFVCCKLEGKSLNSLVMARPGPVVVMCKRSPKLIH